VNQNARYIKRDAENAGVEIAGMKHAKQHAQIT